MSYYISGTWSSICHVGSARRHETIPEVKLAFSQGSLCVGVGRETCLLWCSGLKEGRPSPLERSRIVLHYGCLRDACWPQPRAASLSRQVRAGTQQTVPRDGPRLLLFPPLGSLFLKADRAGTTLEFIWR